MKSNTLKKSAIFKKCSSCRHIWKSRSSFLADPDIEIIGYQADFRELTEGLFLFNHTCGTTMAIKAQFFIDLYNGPIFKERFNGRDQCSGYCLIRENLQPCPTKCECEYVREVLQIVRNWPKNK